MLVYIVESLHERFDVTEQDLKYLLCEPETLNIENFPREQTR